MIAKLLILGVLGLIVDGVFTYYTQKWLDMKRERKEIVFELE